MGSCVESLVVRFSTWIWLLCWSVELEHEARSHGCWGGRYRYWLLPRMVDINFDVARVLDLHISPPPLYTAPCLFLLVFYCSFFFNYYNYDFQFLVVILKYFYKHQSFKSIMRLIHNLKFNHTYKFSRNWNQVFLLQIQHRLSSDLHHWIYCSILVVLDISQILFFFFKLPC